jgi:hypothetical protein
MNRHGDGGRLTVHWQSKCTGVDLDARTVSFEHDGAATQEDYDLLVSAGETRVLCVTVLAKDDSEPIWCVVMEKRWNHIGGVDVTTSPNRASNRPTLRDTHAASLKAGS